MNRWELIKEVKEKYTPIIEEFLNKIENMSTEEIENSENEVFTIEFSDTELRPYTLLKLMEEFGYKEIEFNNNGWELDFWIRMSKECNKITDKICIEGCGMTFELKLTIDEFI